MNARAGRASADWRYLFAAGLVGLGVTSLAYGDFALQWQPMPPWLPWHDGIARLSGGILVIGGIGVCVPLIAGSAAWLLSIYLLLCWFIPQVGAVAPHPGSLGLWLGLFETVVVNAGAWMLVTGRHRQGLYLWGRRSFGIACMIFGLTHVVYAGSTAQMIPPWLPLRLVLAYATGAAHMAAGAAILGDRVPRLAALLEALMMTSFVVFVHLPSIGMLPAPAWAPSTRIQVTAFFWAMTLTGSAWILAARQAGSSRR